MMIKKVFNKTLIGFLAVASMLSCGTPSQENYPVSGTVNNAVEGAVVVLWELGTTSVVPIDSAVIDGDGKFGFSFERPTQRKFYRITMGENRAVLLSMDSVEQVSLTLNADKFSTDYTVQGSEESQNLAELNAILQKSFLAKDSLNRVYQSNLQNMTQELMLEINVSLAAIEMTSAKELKEFIETHTNSLSVLAAVENLDMDANLDIYTKVDNSMGELFPNSEYYEAFHKKFVYNSKLTVGKQVPDIILPNVDGESTQLSSLKGKIVLIDFWASWCKPCRAENPNVVRLYNQYKDKNFEIFGVSLDQNKDAWLRAIEQDQMTWMHVSDLKLWQSPVVRMYNIQAIPLTLLIDEEGVILAKNLRGDALAQKLEEIFG